MPVLRYDVRYRYGSQAYALIRTSYARRTQSVLGTDRFCMTLADSRGIGMATDSLDKGGASVALLGIVVAVDSARCRRRFTVRRGTHSLTRERIVRIAS